MKRNKILSLLLSVSMLTALTACGSRSSDTPAASTTDNGSTTAATESTASSDDGYVLDKVTLVVDGTFNASVDAYRTNSSNNGTQLSVKHWAIPSV